MAGQLKLRRGTTSQLANYIGSEGELTYDTALKSLVLHDGVTLGGVKIPYLSNGLVPSTMLPTATESVVGASKIATTAIAQAGVNDTDIITAKKLRDALNATGNAPIYPCRAKGWVLADGTSITFGGKNISSVTRVSLGKYRIVLQNSLPDEDYTVFAFKSLTANEWTNNNLGLDSTAVKNTTEFTIINRSTSSSGNTDVFKGFTFGVF